MIAKTPPDPFEIDHAAAHDKMSKLFREAVENAVGELRHNGVPIAREIDGKIRYELPDGTMVDEDPWHGKKTAPDGWYQRFGIEPPAKK